MASEKAKELAAQQKAAIKAAKEAKRNSTDPRDWGQWRQMREVYKMTKEDDPALPWILLGSFLVGVAIFVIIGLLLNSVWLYLVAGIGLGALFAMLMFNYRGKKAAYTRYDGKPGSAEVAFGELDKKKWAYTMGVAANRNMDLVHRLIGPGGLLLVSEGGPAAKQLLADTAKRHEAVAYGVKVQTIQMGKGEGQVPLPKLAAYIKKLPTSVEPYQITEIKQRLKALDAVRSKAPLPKGPLPQMKNSMRRAMRGR